MTESTAPLAPLPVAAPRRDHLLRRLLRHRSSRLGLILLAGYVAVIVVGPLLVAGSPTSDPHYQNLGESLQGPSASHWLGTDQLGRDELVRLVIGARYTILIGIGAVVAGVLIGVPLGALSGFYRGWVDLLIQRFIDIVLAFPHFLLALALVAVLGPGLRNLIIAVALASFPRFVRLVRASVLSVREQPFTEAARALGVSERRVLWRHVLPNSLTPVIVQAPLELGSAILTASGLGFLGLGVRQPTPEWGTMLGESRDLIFSNPRLLTYPGLCILGAILAFNLLGDGMRDVLDPRLRSRKRLPRRLRRLSGKAGR
ncbi:ABC transporter permease [Phytohabitans sp. ZYX-F-186]|uniref:ABC transporter permease n=1 Tax=Phytohabitans maris TaxID=3071409 RepID=A0ABU0ZQ15_9ACTN|nr:ABC transporter permease [Phytohabitans sp. ZYX-F-186]MDQ7908017.1 ABC transporter permease [Phytohabitans sp. ZYX-F-186]